MVLSSEFAVGAGASGAIFGVIEALFIFMKFGKKNIENFNPSILALMILLNIFMGFTMNNLPDMPNVGNAAHIGGLITGVLLGYALLIAGRDKGNL